MPCFENAKQIENPIGNLDEQSVAGKCRVFGEMIVNDTYRFVFFHTPKVAGTSIASSLRQLEGFNSEARRGVGTKHLTPVQFLEHFGLSEDGVMPGRSGSALRDYFCFCFVRNPWERFYSLHSYLLTVEKFGGLLRVDFNDFVSQLADREHWLMQLHSVKLQVSYTAPLVTFIGRYETLMDDIAEVENRIGTKIAIPELNRSTVGKPPYRTAYSERSADTVGSFFSKDVEAFGYSF